MKTRSLEFRKLWQLRLPRTVVRAIVFFAAVIMLGVITACKPQTVCAPPEACATASAEELRRDEARMRLAEEELHRAEAKRKRIDSAKTDFVDYVQHMETEYKFEEFYEIDVALAHDFHMPVVAEHAHQKLMSVDKLDVDTVYPLIVRNNEQYKLQDRPWSYWSQPETYYDVEETLLRKYVAIVCEVVNDALASDPRIDRESLLCRVANLKILFGDKADSNGKLTRDGAIVLYPENIDANIEKHFEDRDMYEFYFRHELEHLFHLFCEDERVDGLTKGGVGIKFDDDSLNPLFWNWFYEGSAEKAAMNSMHLEPSTYFFYIAYIDSMTFSFLADPNVSCTTLERIHRPREQQLFFDLFANLEQDEVIKMMYALDLAIKTPYDLETIIDRAANEYGVEMTSKAFRSNLKSDALESMSKNLYLNLLYGIDGRHVELDDVLHIIRLWEFDVNSHIAYYTEEGLLYNEDFMEKYSKMQTKFLVYLCARFDLTLPEMDALLLTYDPRIQREIPWLDEEKNQFLARLAEKNEEYIVKEDGSLFRTIRYYNDILEERRAKAAA